MKKRLSFPLTSLRSRPIIVVGLMIVPLLLLGTGAILSHRTATNALAETTTEIVKEIEPVSNLQLAIAQAVMPPNDYIILGDPDERANFARLGRRADKAFQIVLRSPFADREERLQVSAALRQWRLVKRESLEILAIPRPLESPAAAKKMKQLDGRTDRVVALLDRAHTTAHQEIVQRMARVDRLKRQAFLVVILIFFASVAMATLMGTLLARSVIKPVGILTDGAARFAGGDLHYRAPKLALDELDQFGRTFNVMADKLSANLDALKADETRFRAIANTAVDAIITIDTTGKITFLNEASETLFGYRIDEMLGRDIEMIMPQRLRALHAQGVKRYLQTGEARIIGRTTELEAVRKDGSEFPIELSVAGWKAGDQRFFSGIIRDVTERRKTEDMLRQLSVTDSLTGLFNHAEFYRLLEEEVERSRRYGTQLSVLMIDIDRFKAINDALGHQAGDAVLKALADTIKLAVRQIDKTSRYGGEEFTVILPEVPPAGAAVTAERIRAMIASEPLPEKAGPRADVTVSIGAAAFPDDARTADELVAAADKALYAAKRAGRNRVSPPIDRAA